MVTGYHSQEVMGGFYMTLDRFPTVKSIQHFRPPPGVDQRAAARGLHRAFAEGLLPVHHGTH